MKRGFRRLEATLVVTLEATLGVTLEATLVVTQVEIKKCKNGILHKFNSAE